MEIRDVTRAPRASASSAVREPPASAPAAFGVVLLHGAFFAVGAVVLLVGFAMSTARRLTSGLRGIAGPEPTAAYSRAAAGAARQGAITTAPTASATAASALTP